MIRMDRSGKEGSRSLRLNGLKYGLGLVSWSRPFFNQKYLLILFPFPFIADSKLRNCCREGGKEVGLDIYRCIWDDDQNPECILQHCRQ